MSTDFFGTIEQADPIEVFALVQRYNEDTYSKKVNLSVGGKCDLRIMSYEKRSQGQDKLY